MLLVELFFLNLLLVECFERLMDSGFAGSIYLRLTFMLLVGSAYGCCRCKAIQEP